MQKKAVSAKSLSLSKLPTEVLLSTPVSKILATTAPKAKRISRAIKVIEKELTLKNISLPIEFYYGDEWFTADGTISISIPFFLTHKKLIQLEKKFLNEAEGDEYSYLLKLIRHEVGHCIIHAFKLSRRKDWQCLFGSSLKKYDPDHYTPNPKSKSHVQNLKNHYGQAHPEEDFAETFAVWLNPKSNWRKKYKTRPHAYHKLLYLEKISTLLTQTKKIHIESSTIYSAERMSIPLWKYLVKKLKNKMTP